MREKIRNKNSAAVRSVIRALPFKGSFSMEAGKCDGSMHY